MLETVDEGKHYRELSVFSLQQYFLNADRSGLTIPLPLFSSCCLNPAIGEEAVNIVKHLLAKEADFFSQKQR